MTSMEGDKRHTHTMLMTPSLADDVDAISEALRGFCRVGCCGNPSLDNPAAFDLLMAQKKSNVFSAAFHRIGIKTFTQRVRPCPQHGTRLVGLIGQSA